MTATAFAPTITRIAAHAAVSRAWSSTISPTRAAKTGFTLMNTPKKCAGTRRSASRSAGNGTAEENTPAARAQARASGGPTVPEHQGADGNVERAGDGRGRPTAHSTPAATH